MKTITILLLLGVCGALAVPTFPRKTKGKVADKDFLLKQKNILRLLMHVHQRNTFQDQIEIAKTWKIEAHLDMFTKPEAVKEFVQQYRFGLLPRGEIFSVTDRVQRHQVVSMFHVFFYAKDFETFYKCACWARDHVNEGMFVYAMTVAVLHRPDCQGFVLPPAYEIYPYYFINTEVIQKAYEYKMRNFVGAKKEGEVFVIPSNYTGWYMPVTDEQRITYFTEDIGLNTYYFYFHCDYPFWMGGEAYGLKKDRRGELYYYFHQQLLARYYLERLSNGLGKIKLINWYHPEKTGFVPSLRFQNGMDVKGRPWHANLIKDDYSILLKERIDTIEVRISNAIDSGYVITEDGTKIHLDSVHGMEMLGDLIAGDADSPNKHLYTGLHLYCRMLLGFSGKPIHHYKLTPGALEMYQTALRDPAFYRIYKKIIYYFQRFKWTLPRYTYTDLVFSGVKVENVDVEQMVTYFDKFDVDITNVLYTDLTKEVDTETFRVKARQMRLNHKPFSYRVTVNSDKVHKVLVRTFLGPKYDEFGHFITINENRLNFVEMDKFVTEIKSGKTVIERLSSEFFHTIKDRTTYMDLYHKVMTAISGSGEFVLDQSEAHCGFPNRLILPKGRRGGMAFQWFVMVTPFDDAEVKADYDEIISCGVGHGRFFDLKPMGYPFDRPIDEHVFYVPNMYFQDVQIVHKRFEELNVVV